MSQRLQPHLKEGFSVPSWHLVVTQTLDKTYSKESDEYQHAAQVADWLREFFSADLITGRGSKYDEDQGSVYLVTERLRTLSRYFSYIEKKLADPLSFKPQGRGFPSAAAESAAFLLNKVTISKWRLEAERVRDVFTQQSLGPMSLFPKDLVIDMDGVNDALAQVSDTASDVTCTEVERSHIAVEILTAEREAYVHAGKDVESLTRHDKIVQMAIRVRREEAGYNRADLEWLGEVRDALKPWQNDLTRLAESAGRELTVREQYMVDHRGDLKDFLEDLEQIIDDVKNFED